MFQVNGLAPQTFKHPPYRSNQTRPRKQSRGALQSSSDQSSQGSSQGGSVNSGQGSSRPSTSQQAARSVSPQSNNNTKVNITSKTPSLEGAIPRTGLIHSIVSDSHDAHAASSSSVPLGKIFKF